MSAGGCPHVGVQVECSTSWTSALTGEVTGLQPPPTTVAACMLLIAVLAAGVLRPTPTSTVRLEVLTSFRWIGLGMPRPDSRVRRFVKIAVGCLIVPAVLRFLSLTALIGDALYMVLAHYTRSLWPARMPHGDGLIFWLLIHMSPV